MLRVVTLTRSALATLALALCLSPASALAHQSRSGEAVFVQANGTEANTIVSYTRDAAGSLQRAGTYLTGGRGGTAAGAPIDALASQGSLALDADRDLLLAVNAGSDTLSLLAVHGTRLELRQVVPTGGEFPVSVAVRDRLVYVLNAGGRGSINGFRLGDGHLEPIPGALRDLGNANSTPPAFLTAPSQIGIAPDRSAVLVTTKTLGNVLTYPLLSDGRTQDEPLRTGTGPVPFSFTFDPAGRTVLVDASGLAGTYSVDRASGLTAVGALRPGRDLLDHQGGEVLLRRQRRQRHDHRLPGGRVRRAGAAQP